MNINRHPDGTVEYSGAAFEILDYTAKALGIRKVILQIMYSNVNLKKLYIYLYRYEFVFINLEDVFKYGFRTAQAYAIKNGVIVFEYFFLYY
jgi:hypothetical protein